MTQSPSAAASTPVSVVLPAFNEGASVADEVRAVRLALAAAAIPHEIIVVDDGSEDATGDEARQAGARVLRHTVNRGYGAAIKSGVLAAKHDVVVITDADGTYPAEQIPTIVSKLRHADMVVGARIGPNVVQPTLRRPAKWVLRRLAALIAGQPIPDLNSGLRAFRRSCLQQYFPVLSNRFSFTTTSTLALLADDYVVAYHPIDYRRRKGTSKISPRHFMDFLMLVLRISMVFQPLRLFVPVALFFIGVGGLKGVYDVATLFIRARTVDWSLLYQPALSTSAIFLTLTGLQLMLIGMVADAVVRRIALHNGAMERSFSVETVAPDVDSDPTA